MVPASFEQKYARPVIGVLSAYEAVAIASKGRVPTISAGVWRLYKNPAGRPFLWLIWGWLTSHFFNELREEIREEVEESTERAIQRWITMLKVPSIQRKES